MISASAGGLDLMESTQGFLRFMRSVVAFVAGIYLGDRIALLSHHGLYGVVAGFLIWDFLKPRRYIYVDELRGRRAIRDRRYR
jgi:hypothetical protein